MKKTSEPGKVLVIRKESITKVVNNQLNNKGSEPNFGGTMPNLKQKLNMFYKFKSKQPLD